MENDNNQDLLVINSTPEEVGAIVHTIGYEKAVIREFVETMGVQGAIIFCAWFIGNLDIQDPKITKDFERAREVGRDVATILNGNYKTENPDEDFGENLMIIYPRVPVDNQPSLLVH